MSNFPRTVSILYSSGSAELINGTEYLRVDRYDDYYLVSDHNMSFHIKSSLVDKIKLINTVEMDTDE